LLHFFSLITAKKISNEGAAKLSEILKTNTSLTALNLHRTTTYCFVSFSLYTGNNIGYEGALELCEALKSNSSLTALNLSGNSFVSSLHPHKVQITRLALKE
jgi:hypothetical protein